MIRFVFNERKAAQAAAFLLRLADGQMDAHQLMTMLYLADREALLDRGYPITGSAMANIPDSLLDQDE